MRPAPLRRRQSGFSLLEAMVAFLVLSIGLLTVARFQGHQRLDAEVARQRSEAVRAAQADIESLRTFPVLAGASGAPSFQAVTGETRTLDPSTGFVSNTTYQLDREVSTSSALQARSVRVMVGWTDRRGDPRDATLVSVIAGIAPAFGGALALPREPVPSKGVFGRSVRVPTDAKDLGDGRSAVKSSATSTIAFAFDNSTGRVIGRCAVPPASTTAALTASGLTGCDTVVGYLVSGVVRFTSVQPPDPADATEPPLPVSIVMQAIGGPYPNPPVCDAEPVTTPEGDRFVAYRCVVYPQPGGSWSGRTVIVPNGWTVGAGAGDRRICRYSADLDASGAIDADLEHPAVYAAVDRNLARQNFLVVVGSATCPAGAPVQAAGNNGDVPVDLSTVPHQP